MATITFKLRPPSKATKLSAVQIRFSVRSDQREVVQTDIKVNPKYWDKSKHRVSQEHPNANIINEALDVYRAKMNEAKTRMEAGTLTFFSAIDYVVHKFDASTIDDYLETHFAPSTTNVNAEEYRKALRYFKMHLGIKGKLRFEDVDNALVKRFTGIANKKVREGTHSHSTFRSYLNQVMGILNDAIANGHAPERKISKKSRRIEKVRTDNKANTPEEITELIKRATTIHQMTSIGLWLLMFGLRGMYPADLVRFKSSRLKTKTLRPARRDVIAIAKDDVYIDYDRSKEGVPMFIRMSYETRCLWKNVKHAIIYTHNSRKINGKHIVTGLEDTFSLFKYDNREHPKEHKDIWDNFNDKFAKSLKMRQVSFKRARKSFIQTAEDLYSKWDAKWLAGHTIDTVTSESYSDYRREKVIEKTDKMHYAVLDEFGYEKLVYAWIGKFAMLVEKNREYPMWLQAITKLHWEGKTLKAEYKISNRRAYWCTIEKKYHRFLHYKPLEGHYYEDVDEFWSEQLVQLEKILENGGYVSYNGKKEKLSAKTANAVYKAAKSYLKGWEKTGGEVQEKHQQTIEEGKKRVKVIQLNSA